MKQLASLSIILLVFAISFNAYWFTIDEINSSIDDFSIDLQWDKVDYRFSTQDKIKKNSNGDFINIKTDDYIDSTDNLNLDTIDKVEVEDNSEQGESKEEYKWSVIPINYFENKQEDITNNVIRKETSFEIEYYEEGVIQVKKGLQRYYNPDLSNVLLWWVPSTFWFWQWSVTTSVDESGLDLGQWNNWWWIISGQNCAETCNCGSYYNFLWVCKIVPANWYSTGNNYKCNRGFYKSWGKCVYSWTNNDVPITDSPYSDIKYDWIQIDWSDDPFWLSVKQSSSTNSSSINLWIPNSGYQYSPNVIQNFSPAFYNNTFWSTCANASYTYPVFPCTIKNSSSIYDIPGR